MSEGADLQARASLLRLQSGARLRVRVAGAERLVRLRDVTPDGLRIVERLGTREPRLLPWDAIERVDCRLPASRTLRVALALATALLLGLAGWAWERRDPAGSHGLPTGTLVIGGAILGAVAGGARRRWNVVYERGAIGDSG